MKRILQKQEREIYKLELLSFPDSFQLCLVRKLASLSIDEEIGLESDLTSMLEKFFEIRHKVVKELELWFLKSAEEEKFSFPCQMSSEDNKFTFFSLSPRCFESHIGRQITLFSHYSLLFE